MESKPCRQHHIMDLPLIGDSMSDIFPLWETYESKWSTELRTLVHRGDHGCMGIGSPVGGPHSLGEIRGAAAVGIVPMGVGVARLFLKTF